MKKRRNRLTGDDLELWQRVTETTTPLQKHPFSKPKPPEPTGTKPRPQPEPVPKFRVGETSTKSSVRLPETKPAVQMDHGAYQKLKRGKLKPEARIDLHGMTVATAHAALTAFLFRAKSDGKRLVLVITGKGKQIDDQSPIPRRTGVLRQQLPHWLEVPPLKQLILQVSPAHQKHGGSGAFYIYLRR